MFFHILNWSLAEATPGYRDAGQTEGQQKPRRAVVRDVAGDAGDGIGDAGTPANDLVSDYCIDKTHMIRTDAAIGLTQTYAIIRQSVGIHQEL